MPDYSVVFTGPNGQLYHDRNFTQPFTPEEMQRIWQQRSTYPGAQPGGGPANTNYPSQQNWPGGNMPTYDLNYTPGNDAGYVDPFRSDAGLSSGNPSDGIDWTRLLVQLGLNFASNKLLNKKTSEEKRLTQYSTAPYASSEIQGFLPPALQENFTGPITLQGLMAIAELLRNPGGMRSGVADAIRPRLAQESATIAQNYRGIQSNQAGAAARGNLPVSIKSALQSALDVAQERAQRGARQTALSESESLRREDIGQTYKLLDTLLQFTSSGRGQAIPGLQAAAQMAGNRQAAQQASYGTILSNVFPSK